jgi:hypothetical protein
LAMPQNEVEKNQCSNAKCREKWNRYRPRNITMALRLKSRRRSRWQWLPAATHEASAR